jgi:hypothetical protein
VLTGTSRELLTTVAGGGAALTGLLFVAMSIAPRSRMAGQPAVIREVRAAASLLAFTNALAVSLFGLVPHDNAGYPALVMAVIGILFTAAGTRSILLSPATTRLDVRRQAGLVVLLLAAFVVEFVAGVGLVHSPASSTAADTLCNVLVALLIIGVARAWELVGDRDTGIIASIAVLTGRDGGGRDGDRDGGGRDGERVTETAE